MSKNYPTPHIAATPDDFAKTVLMPGDPKRSEFIAKEFLTGAKLINDIRGVQGYTGEYKGKRISVMASGMGMPSMGIYSYELYNFFDIDNIIRIGTAGSIQEEIKIGDIVIGMGTSTDSAYFNQFDLPGTYAATANYHLLETCKKTADEMNLKNHIGTLLSSDRFYDEDPNLYKKWKQLGVMAIEMEAAALYVNAQKAKKNAIAICTVSNNIINPEYMSDEDAKIYLSRMIELSLNTAIKL